MNINHSEYWDRQYREERPRWDLGGATPVFENWLKNSNSFGAGRIAILGCGNGHDALLFAENGFDVTAIDFALEPLKYLEANIPTHQKNIRLLQADLFGLPDTYKGCFDFVLEYTCYCAIDPERRDEYVEAVYRMLKPTGVLIALFYPMDGRADGPPFAVRYEEIEEKFAPRFKFMEDEIPNESVQKRRGKERFVVLQKI